MYMRKDVTCKWHCFTQGFGSLVRMVFLIHWLAMGPWLFPAVLNGVSKMNLLILSSRSNLVGRSLSSFSSKYGTTWVIWMQARSGSSCSNLTCVCAKLSMEKLHHERIMIPMIQHEQSTTQCKIVVEGKLWRIQQLAEKNFTKFSNWQGKLWRVNKFNYLVQEILVEA